MKLSPLALLILVAGFVVTPACFLGPGSRAPRPAPRPATQGPRVERGGQRMLAPPPADPASAARAALAARGWTPQPSTRSDEVLGTIHDNLACVRWTSDGWWVRVDQRSDFATRQQVPTWDHPWEALRLLHLLAPQAGPAVGWLEPVALVAALGGSEAEDAHRALLLAALAGKGCTDQDILRLREHLAVSVDQATLRARLAWLLAQPAPPVDQPSPWRDWRFPVPTRRLRQAQANLLLASARNHTDPFCVLPVTATFAEPDDAWRSRRFARSAPEPRGKDDDDLIAMIIHAQRSGQPPPLADEAARIVALMPPGSAGPGDADFAAWWREAVEPWLATFPVAPPAAQPVEPAPVESVPVGIAPADTAPVDAAPGKGD